MKLNNVSLFIGAYNSAAEGYKNLNSVHGFLVECLNYIVSWISGCRSSRLRCIIKLRREVRWNWPPDCGIIYLVETLSVILSLPRTYAVNRSQVKVTGSVRSSPSVRPFLLINRTTKNCKKVLVCCTKTRTYRLVRHHWRSSTVWGSKVKVTSSTCRSPSMWAVLGTESHRK